MYRYSTGYTTVTRGVAATWSEHPKIGIYMPGEHEERILRVLFSSIGYECKKNGNKKFGLQALFSYEQSFTKPPFLIPSMNAKMICD